MEIEAIEAPRHIVVRGDDMRTGLYVPTEGFMYGVDAALAVVNHDSLTTRPQDIPEGSLHVGCVVEHVAPDHEIVHAIRHVALCATSDEPHVAKTRLVRQTAKLVELGLVRIDTRVLDLEAEALKHPDDSEARAPPATAKVKHRDRTASDSCDFEDVEVCSQPRLEVPLLARRLEPRGIGTLGLGVDEVFEGLQTRHGGPHGKGKGVPTGMEGDASGYYKIPFLSKWQR